MNRELCKLQTLAALFRRALENEVEHNSKLGIRGNPIDSFPRGACGEASRLLATYLRDQGFGTFKYCWGRRGEKSHAWLKRGDLIVDITADQFDDQESPIIVSTNSEWHSSFTNLEESSALFDSWEDPFRNKMNRFYRQVVHRMQS
jgi:hypothetical protein